MIVTSATISAKHAAQPGDRFLDVRARVERRQPEVALARRAEPGARRADHLRLVQQAIEELPRGRVVPRPDPQVRGVNTPEDREPGAGQRVSLNALWSRRHTTKFNGASYVVQRGAAAAYSAAGLEQTNQQIAFYMENARLLREGLAAAGFTIFGGVHAPYIWIRTAGGASSWEFFDHMLNKAQVVGTPGAGFGPAGEGYFRLSAFNSRENVEEAIGRIRKAFG